MARALSPCLQPKFRFARGNGGFKPIYARLLQNIIRSWQGLPVARANLTAPEAAPMLGVLAAGQSGQENPASGRRVQRSEEPEFGDRDAAAGLHERALQKTPPTCNRDTIRHAPDDIAQSKDIIADHAVFAMESPMLLAAVAPPQPTAPLHPSQGGLPRPLPLFRFGSLT